MARILVEFYSSRTPENLVSILSEIFAAAAGLFAAERKGVYFHRYDVKKNVRLFRYPEKEAITPPFPRYLCVDELLALGGNRPIKAPRPCVSKESERQILRLWSAVRRHGKEWNRFCSLSAEKGGVRQKILAGEGANRTWRVISRCLKEAGILFGENYKTKKSGGTQVDFSLDVPEECLFLYDKAGNLLEMMGALAAHRTGLFSDIRVGVILDWDGKSAKSHQPDPRNEVDLFLMQNSLPILVSCKNTVPQKEHLYEIMIMAKHYGGFYAKPALFASGRATETVRRRAKEMEITLIDGIATMSVEALTQRIKALFS